MQMKRFFAKDNHEVLKLVREELGPNAIIISNRKSGEGVEVIASAAYDEEQVRSALSADTAKPVTEDLQVTVAQQAPDTPTRATFAETLHDVQEEDATISAMKSELSHLRSLLDGQIAAMQVGQWGQQSKARAELFDKLTRIGLGVELVTQLIAETDVSDDLETASRKVLVKLKDSIRISKTDAVERGGVVVLHGPTGAGKTTTIAKLAVQFLKKNDPRDLVLVCADNGRVGAYEQLQTFGKLLGVSVVRIRHSRELSATVGVLSSKKLVLIDSAGMVQEDLRNPQNMIGIGKQLDNIFHYLVLPATMQRAAMERILDSLSNAEIEGIILTKLDDAAHLGSALTSLLRHKLPLSYWTDGQSIANDIRRADAAVLVSKAMHLNKSAVENNDDRLMASMLQQRSQASELWR